MGDIMEVMVTNPGGMGVKGVWGADSGMAMSRT